MVTLKQFVGNIWRIVWVCLTILWGWRLKDKENQQFRSIEKDNTTVNFEKK